MTKENNKTILIIEDEKAMRDALREEFSAEGFTAYEAADGEEGLAMIKEKRPDLVLLDIIMPKMDGLTMLKKLQEDDSIKNTPIIMLTNLTDSESVVDSVKNGAYNFLVKADWKLVDIVRMVKDKLK